ncbi:MAG: Bax inhibitor-1/YccA family protein [Alphaproteobacteria bacterium]|nr:Bax inhibitor-1/YccA family protein [Alphaproteobacteria bacterium]
MNFEDFNTISKAQAGSYESGLRAYMVGVFNKMFMALGLTGAISFLLSTNKQAILFMFQHRSILILLALATFGISFTLSLGLHKMKLSTANGLFWAFATLNGIIIAPLLAIYTGSSVAMAFLSSAALFGGMSLVGYTTKKDLTSFGTFLFVGLIVICITSFINFIWLHNSALSMALSAISVLVFCGLTAYNVQHIKRFYEYAPSNEILSKLAVLGAFQLYLDFINLFTNLLRLFGESKD